MDTVLATPRDRRLLRALHRGETPRGSENDLSRLLKLLGHPCVNRAHPIHEPPYLFPMDHVDLPKPAREIISDYLAGDKLGNNQDG